MGCGKSTLGRKLANRMGVPFLDLDKLIETKTGLSIAGFFDHFGENAFRELEKETLQHTEFPENCVISTGGGAPCYSDNMDWMNRNGTTIFISLPPKVLADRLKNAKEERPLLRNFDDEQLLKFITERLQQRIEFYERAQYVLSGIDLTAEGVMNSLART